jgi:molybdate transport system substrate-binding protein
MTLSLRYLFLVFALLLCRAAHAQEVRIAAAADLKFALDDLSPQYRKQSGMKVDISYGSSGNFFAQIQNGAPFDIFLSADIEYPRKLETAGLTEQGTLYEYAIGRLVIWTPADSRIDLANLGWKALLDPTVEKVAALRKAGIYEQVRTKLVYGENIGQAAQFVVAGSAQAGIVAFSLAVSPPMRDGKRWEIPAHMHPPIKQGAVILKNAKNKEGAQAFMAFLKSAAGQKLLNSYGFASPQTHAADARH